MKLELKENMYVRTEYSIFKYLGIDEEGNYRRTLKDDNKNITTAFDIDRVLKASFNIIDLIEVGDYVNGYPATAILSSNNKVYEIQVKRPNNRNGVWIERIRKNEDIKSMVTKEQFEYMEYRIGE